MAKGNPPAGHQPLSYRDRLRLNAAIKHLRSRFHSVRIAAHKEIQAILHKKRGVTRLREWVTKTSRATVRKVTPKPLHKALRVKEKTAPAQARTNGTPTPLVRDMPKQGLRAPGGFGQTTADLKERTKAAHRAARGKDPQAPARAPGQPQPARMTAPAPSRDKTIGKPAPTLQQAAPPPDWTRRDVNAPLDWRPAARPAEPQRAPGSRADGVTGWRPVRGAPAPAPPLPAQTVERDQRPSRIRLPRLRTRANS